MAKSWRWKKLVNLSIQGPIILRLLMHFLAYNAATLCLLLVVYSVKRSVSAIADHPDNTAPMTLWQQAAPVVFCMLVMMPFMVWDLIQFTNRIAGPLYRFETLLNDFSRTGKLKAATLRRDDLLTDYQRRFNDFVAAIHVRCPETQPASVAPAAECVTADVAIRQINLASAQL